MKRFIVIIAALAAVAALLTGCGGMDNVSHNPDGMIESSRATEATTRVTTPTEATRSRGSAPTTATEETGMGSPEASTEDAPSARGNSPRRF